jgi:hypothetical protein
MGSCAWARTDGRCMGDRPRCCPVSASLLTSPKSIGRKRSVVTLRGCRGCRRGSWSQYLAQRGCSVLAVDPAQLHPRAASLPRIRHWRGTASAALEHLALSARSGGASAADTAQVTRSDGKTANAHDIFVCDMCLHSTGDATNALLQAASSGLLNDGALCVVAIKVCPPSLEAPCIQLPEPRVPRACLHASLLRFDA